MKLAFYLIIFYATGFTLLYVLKFFRTKSSIRKGKEILKLYINEDLKSVDVKISETKYSRFSNGGGTLGFLNTKMYYSESLIIFTQNENSNFEKLNFTLPLVVQPQTIKNIFIKSDEYILYIENSTSGRKIQVYSDKENDLLKVIFNNFKNNILKT